MNKLYQLTTLIVVTALLVPMFVFSAEPEDGITYEEDQLISDTPLDTDLPDPGMSPNNPFYFLDSWGENFGLLFCFCNAKEKSNKALAYAEEKLSEGKLMAETKTGRDANKAFNNYENYLERAEKIILQSELSDEKIDEQMVMLADNALRHVEVITEVYEKVPEPAQAALSNVLQKSLDRYQNLAEGIKNKNTLTQIMARKERANRKLERLQLKFGDVPEMQNKNQNKKNSKDGEIDAEEPEEDEETEEVEEVEVDE